VICYKEKGRSSLYGYANLQQPQAILSEEGPQATVGVLYRHSLTLRFHCSALSPRPLVNVPHFYPLLDLLRSTTTARHFPLHSTGVSPIPIIVTAFLSDTVYPSIAIGSVSCFMVFSFGQDLRMGGTLISARQYLSCKKIRAAFALSVIISTHHSRLRHGFHKIPERSDSPSKLV
jgi:hypothetical protein